MNNIESSASKLVGAKFTVLTSPVNYERIKITSYVEASKQGHFSSKAMKMDYSAFDLRDDIARIIEKQMIKTARLADRTCLNDLARDFVSDIKEGIDFTLVEESDKVSDKQGSKGDDKTATIKYMDDVCKATLPMFMNILDGNEIGKLVCQISIANLKRLMYGFSFKNSCFKLSYSSENLFQFVVENVHDKNVISIDEDEDANENDDNENEEVEDANEKKGEGKGKGRSSDIQQVKPKQAKIEDKPKVEDKPKQAKVEDKPEPVKENKAEDKPEQAKDDNPNQARAEQVKPEADNQDRPGPVQEENNKEIMPRRHDNRDSKETCGDAILQ
eukprot:699286-Hanusia_phi.AAC.1